MASEDIELEEIGGTLNFFLHGTRYHEGGNVQSLISKFAEVADNAIIANGPGSESLEEEAVTSTPGLYALDRQNQRVEISQVIPHGLIRAIGLVAGYGVEHNLMEMFLRVVRAKPIPKTINLMGFSRGADACLRFANILYLYAPFIEINIVAIEPVAGPGRGQHDYARRIPPNVKNYVATLAMNENRAIMTPQDLSRVYVVDPESSKVKFLPIPGEHGTHARLINEHPETWDASKLVADIAYDYLQSWGQTMPQPAYTVDPNINGGEQLKSEDYRGSKVSHDKARMLKRYANMRLHLNEYGKIADGRFFTHHLIDYCPILPEYFFNLHHLETFAAIYPETLNWLLNHQTGEPPQHEWQTMDAVLKDSFARIRYKSQEHIHYNIDDRYDGNYLKIVMAAQRFLNNTIAGKAVAYALLNHAHEIMKFEYTGEEKEHKLQELAEQFRDDPNTPEGLKERLQKRFGGDDFYVLKSQVKDQLQAADNMNTLLEEESAYEQRHTEADNSYFRRFADKIHQLQKLVDHSQTREELRQNMAEAKAQAKAEAQQERSQRALLWVERQYRSFTLHRVLTRIVDKIDRVISLVKGFERVR